MRRKTNSLVGILALGAMVLGLSACTPANEQYCQSFGVTGAEMAKCLNYYDQQQAIFDADLSVCSMNADITYPPTLYDYGHTEHIPGGFGYNGQYYGGTMINIPPDYNHNRQVDALRMRIIGPCMDARGWNSPTSWIPGRHATGKAAKRSSSGKLPWQK